MARRCLLQVKPRTLKMALLGALLLFVLFLLRQQPDAQSPGPVASAPGVQEPALQLAAPPSRPAEKQSSTDSGARAERVTRYHELKAGLALAATAREARESASRRDAETEPALPLPPPSLDTDYIVRQVQEIVPLVRECYDMALEIEPELAGKVVVRWSIVGEPEIGGLVESSEVLPEESDISSPDFLLCVQESIYAMELEAPKGGGRVTVNYPMVFVTSDGD